MDAIPALLSSVFGKFDPFSPPSPDAIRRRLIATWRTALTCPTLDLESATAALTSLLQESKSAVQAGHKAIVLAAFAELKIVPTLTAFAISDRPAHFVDALLPFLEEHMAAPLTPLVSDAWFRSVNNLLEYGARPKRSRLAKFVHQAILFVCARPAWLPALITAPTKAPFFRRAFEMIAPLHNCMGALALQIASHSAMSPDFQRYIIDHSAYIPGCVTFILECMLERTGDRGKFRFVHEFALSIANGPRALRDAFVDEFEQVVVRPFVLQMDARPALDNAIWLMAALEDRKSVV
jgi:hypothetical protein